MSGAFDPFAFSEAEFNKHGAQGVDVADLDSRTREVHEDLWGQGQIEIDDPWWVQGNKRVTDDILQFSANVATGNDGFEDTVIFPDDPMTSSQANAERNTIHVALHEQLACVYNGTESSPSSRVQGSIHLRSSFGNPFYLVVKDPRRHVEALRPDPTFCTEPDGISNVLRIVLPTYSGRKEKVASYTCTSNVKPMPLLVKSKVLLEGDRCRVGVKVRTNPANVHPLVQVAIIMAVPPDIEGETVKLSLKGSTWDPMKRILAWSIGRLEPGELMEIQAHFSLVNPDRPETLVPRFPVLVRCEATNDQFSNIELATDTLDDSSLPVRLRLTRSTRIIFRKI